MQLTRNTLDTMRGPADWFTGTVYIDTITSPEGDWNLGAAAVRLAATRLMTHVAMQLADESGSRVTCGEHVSDGDYAQAPVAGDGER